MTTTWEESHEKHHVRRFLFQILPSCVFIAGAREWAQSSNIDSEIWLSFMRWRKSSKLIGIERQWKRIRAFMTKCIESTKFLKMSLIENFNKFWPFFHLRVRWMIDKSFDFPFKVYVFYYFYGILWIGYCMPYMHFRSPWPITKSMPIWTAAPFREKSGKCMDRTWSWRHALHSKWRHICIHSIHLYDIVLVVYEHDWNERNWKHHNMKYFSIQEYEHIYIVYWACTGYAEAFDMIDNIHLPNSHIATRDLGPTISAMVSII